MFRRADEGPVVLVRPLASLADDGTPWRARTDTAPRMTTMYS